MTASKSRMRSRVISVNLGAMSGHRLRHTPYTAVGSAQELIPEHRGRSQLGVVPGISSHVIPPLVATCVISVHHVSIVEESIPSVSLNLPFVEVHDAVESALHERVATVLPYRQTPDAESPLAVEIGWSGQQDALLVGVGIYI